jgi:sulfotransferase
MRILEQNPQFTVGPDSSLPYVLSVLHGFAQDHIKYEQLPYHKFSECLLEFCRSGSRGWVNTVCPTSHFLDKNRAWIFHYQFMFQVFPDLKVLLCVRDLRGIANSFEKIHHESICIEPQSLYSNFDEDFMMQRVNFSLSQDYIQKGLVSIKELIEVKPKCRDQILICKYEDMVQYPTEFLSRVYDFLGVPSFKHDLENISSDPNQLDNVFRPYGDHSVSAKLQKDFSDPFPFLTPAACDTIVESYLWFYRQFYPEIVS